MNQPDDRSPASQKQQSTGFRRPTFPQSVVLSGAGTAVNITFLLVETMVAARFLSTDQYGMFVLLVAVVNFFVTLVDLGGKTSVTQFLASSDRDLQSVLVQSTLVLRLVVLGAASLLIWLSRKGMAILDPSGELLRFAVLIPAMLALSSLDELFLAMLQGFHAFQHMAIAQIIRSVLRLCLSLLFLVVLNMGIMALVYSWLISFAVSSAYGYWALPTPKRLAFQWHHVWDMLKFGIPIQLNRLLWFAYSRVDILLLGALAGPTSVALYSVASRIPSALMRLSQAYTSVFFPEMTALLAKGRQKDAQQILDRSLRLCSFGGALAAFGAILFSRQIIVLLFSAKYEASSLAFALLMIGFHMVFLVSLMGYTLTAAGFPERSLMNDGTRTALMVAIDLALIPAIGFLGPAYANVLAAYAANPLGVWLLRRSGILVRVFAYVKQTVLLLAFAASYQFLSFDSIAYKTLLLGLFALASLMLSTVTKDDLRLIIPETVSQRLALLRKATTYGR